MAADDKDGIEELARAIDALFLTMRQGRSVVVASDQLSIAQQALLEALLEALALPVGALASAAGVSVPTATRMLKQLEAKGALTRTRLPEDERRVMIELTPAGRELVSRQLAYRREMQKIGFAEFAPDERVELAAQLRRLTRIMKEHAPH